MNLNEALSNWFGKLMATNVKPSLTLRIIAGGTLLIWLSALALCQLHCCGDNDHADAKNFAAQTGTPDSHNGSRDHHDDSACHTLKSALPFNSPIALVKPIFGLAFNLIFLSPVTSVEISASKNFISRQPPDSISVFTPEVSLGPAFRSLAPPSLA
ncbi:MAG TPA: hypothetical protein VMF08_19370 [Candidatus Sulfotelmatobacter sp.]|nr:hypothetical protein [Candidatus Sulfotelmatobacter sp.]